MSVMDSYPHPPEIKTTAAPGTGPTTHVVSGLGLTVKDSNPINPDHYRSHPSGVECIQITEHMDFLLGNATKYIWRAGLKDNALQDLEKAKWYLERKIKQMEAE